MKAPTGLYFRRRDYAEHAAGWSIYRRFPSAAYVLEVMLEHAPGLPDAQRVNAQLIRLWNVADGVAR